MKSIAPDSLPTQAALTELEAFRSTFREALEENTRRMEEQLDALRSKVEALASAKKIPGDRGRDLRDMLTLLRGHKLNPAKGRWKTLRKLVSVADDLDMLTERW